MKRFLVAVTVLVTALLFTAPASARNRAFGFCEVGDKTVVVSGLNGAPKVQASYPGCTVTVYLTGTLTLATLYSDNSSTPLANPFTASSSTGYWFFYADDGRYDIVESGAGFPAPFTISDYNLTSGSGGGNVKPSSLDGITYVSLEGDDSNDCLSWGSACLTILGAYNKLSADGGTIYVTSGRQGTGPQCTPTTGQGLGFASSADPNWASMPGTFAGSPGVYWVKQKNGFSGVTIEGYSGTNSNYNATTPPVTPVVCGGATAPAFQMSGVAGYALKNLGMAYPKNGVLVQVDSNGDKTGSVTAGSDIVLENLVINIDNCNGCSAVPGPTILIGGNLIWARLYNLALQGNSGAATPEGRAAITVETDGGNASLLIHMSDINTTLGGNLVWENDQMTGTGTFDVNRWVMEGTGLHVPVIDIRRGNPGIVFGEARDIVMSDAGLAPLIHVPPDLPPYTLRVAGQFGQDAVTLDGPVDIEGVMRQGGISGVAQYGTVGVATVAPQALAETGYPLGRLSNVQADVSRRTFLTLARFTNLAAQLPSAWTTTSGFVTITPGQVGPDTSTNAADVSTSGGSADAAIAYSASPTYHPGDYLYVGVWARMASTAGVNASQITNSSLCLCFPFGSGPTVRLLAGSYNANAVSVLAASSAPQSDGEWQWLWAVGKVVGSYGAAGTRLQLTAQPTEPMEFYAPIFVKLAASDLALVPAPTFASASESGNTVTMATSGNHLLSPGEPVMISGCNITGYNMEAVILTTPTPTTFTYFDKNTPLAAPSGCAITPGNDSEAADWAENTGTWADTAPVGILSGPRGIALSFGGSGDFFGTLTNANTANRVYTVPDSSGQLSLARFYDCATTAACMPSEHLLARTLIGDAQLNNASPSLVTITGMSPGFTSNATYHCVASDETSATTTFMITYNSGTSFTITAAQNTITDTLHYLCVGY